MVLNPVIYYYYHNAPRKLLFFEMNSPEVLWHGEDPGGHVDGDEHPAEQHEDEDGVELVRGNADA